MGFKSSDNVPQVYLDNGTASLALGIDTNDSNKLKLLAQATVGAAPTTGQIVIDPSANGNITLNPNGSGTVNIDYATQYTVAVYGASGALSEVSGVGSAGQALVSNGPAMAPTFQTISSTGAIMEFTPDSGTSPVVPDVSGNITMVGGLNLVSVGGLNSLTFNLAGTTNHAVQVGNASNALTSLSVGTNGQVLVGATGANPAFATITSTGSTISFSLGANTLNMETGAAVATSYSTDSGSAVPAAGVLTVAGGTNIGSTGAASTVTLNLDSSLVTMDNITFNTGGALRTGTGAGNTLLLQAYDTDTGPAYVTFATLTAGTTPTFDLNTATTIGTAYIYRVGGTDVSVADGGTGTSTLLDHGVLVGSGTSPVDALAVGTDGQVLVGSSGADPVFATLTSSGGTITYTPGAGTLNLEAAASVPTSFVTDSGTATPALNSLDILGGNNIATSGTGDAVTIDLNGTTDHAVQIGNATGSLTSLGIGTTGQVLTGVTASDPVWAAPAASSISITGDSGGALVGAAFTFTGASTGLTFAGSGSTETLGGILVVSNGGTGVASLADHGVMLGSGTGTVTVTSVGTDGQVLVGATGADPAFATLTSTGGTITFTPGANTLNLEAAGSSFTWNEETGTSATMAVNNGYVSNNAGLVTFTLPDTAAFGSVVRVVGKGAGGWKIAQNAGESIVWDEAASTTVGVTGFLASTDDFDSVELLCTTADTTWVVLSSKGNITVS